jgi:tetratricopeptide (TPR) repeat protein
MHYTKEDIELNDQRFKEVKKAFTRATYEDKNYASVYNTAGYVYEMFKRSDKAIDQYDKAIAKDPHTAIPWYNKAYAICSKITSEHSNGHIQPDEKDREEYKKAIRYLDYSIKLDPNDPWTWYYKGHVLYNGLNKHDEALNHFQKTLEIDPKSLYALYNIGLIYNDEEKYNEGLKYFDRSLDCIEKIQEIEGMPSILVDPRIAKTLED